MERHRTGRGGHRGIRGGALAATAALALGLTACGAGAGASTGTRPLPDCSATAPRMTVGASGTASATPDIVTVSLGVQVDDPTAAAALSDANAQATALTGTLERAGVASSDEQTTDFSITPTFASNGRISGYQVSNMIVVTLHDLDGAGGAIDAAAVSVGNAIRVEGITFSVSDTGGVDARARAVAVTAAAAHAHAMARAAGEVLGGVCSVSDTTANPTPVAAFDGVGVPMSGSVPLEPGTQQASAQVTVVYALGPR